ncbi:MAG: hypothetical protein ACLUUO_16360 [Sellimonas intestinalis]
MMKCLAVIIEDLNRLKKEYGVKRRTLLENAEEAVYEEKKIEEQEVVCLIDRFGYARTVDPSVYERNQEAADLESRYIITCMNTGKLCLLRRKGVCTRLRYWSCLTETSGAKGFRWTTSAIMTAPQSISSQ